VGDTPVLASARFDGAKLSDVKDRFVTEAWNDDGGNTGSRIAFGLDEPSLERANTQRSSLPRYA
jgi:hypothetical protein